MATTPRGGQSDDEQRWRELARQLRVDCVRAVAAAGSGHVPSALSAADLMAVLLDSHLRYDFSKPRNPNNHRLIFSKGHAAPLLYSMFRAVEVISDEELLSLRRFGSLLEGHPTPRLKWVETATGSLGQGLPIAVGMALGQRTLKVPDARVWVLCGDGEMAEGSMWEAFEHAAFERLDSLTIILDVNRFGQGYTRQDGSTAAFAKRCEAFGWHAIEIDGHNPCEINAAYVEARATTGRPTVVVARTVKGKGIRAIEGRRDAHSKPLVDAAAAIQELGGHRHRPYAVAKPDGDPTVQQFKSREVEFRSYRVGELVSLREAFGAALAAVGTAREEVVVVDADVSASTCTDMFARAGDERFFQTFIAEQQMVATAVGLQALGFFPFASTFSAFLTRAHDFIRMAAVSQARLCLAGSHPGVSIGRDGPSQMGLEDLAAMRALNGSVVLYPSDANQLNRLVERVAKHKGISYLRVTRAELPVLYPAGEQFRIGGSRILHRSRQDDVTLVAAGITLHEALTAYKDLLGRGIRARVIDLYSVKPVDERTLREAAIATGGRVVTVEDHWPEGGLGDAVLAVLTTANIPLSLAKLAVPALPGSGSPAEQLRAARIDAAAIAEAAVALVAGRATAWRASRSRSSCRGWTPRRSRTSQILRGSAAGFASVIPFGFQSITTIHTGITLAVAVPCAAVLFLCIDRSINQFLASRSRAAGAERPDTDAPEPGPGPI